MDECLSYSLNRTELSIHNEVKDKINQSNIKELKADEEFRGEYIDSIEGDNRQLRRDLKRLQGENRSLRDENKQLKLALRYASSASSEDISDDSPQEFTSVEDAVNHAQLSLGGLRFLENAFETARSSQFRRPSDVYKAFEALDDCASKLEHDDLGMSPKLWLHEKYGIEYTPQESITTMGQYGDHRRFRDRLNNRTVEMQAHVKLGGGGNNPQLQMRIHVRWEESENKWLVGHVGGHLPTATG